MKRTAFLWFCCVLLCACASGQQMTAGVARVDITPPAGLAMYGYMDRTRGATGVLDPLYARVLVLSVRQTRVALVTLDLGRTFGPWWLQRLRDTAQRDSGITGLIVAASHTHSGPNLLDEYKGDPPAWEVSALQRIATGISSAARGQIPARLSVGYGAAFIGYNRRQINGDGSVTMLWSNPSKVPTEPLDPTVVVLRVNRINGSPLALVVNYACHPVIFGVDNLQYSADYVGVMARTVENELGGNAICFFLQGGDGDINPYYATTPLAENAVGRRDWTGETIGCVAAAAARAAKPDEGAMAEIQFSEDILPVSVRWKDFRSRLLARYGERVFRDHAESFTGGEPKTVPMVVTTLLLNRRIGLIGFSGEPFVTLQMEARRRAPVDDLLFAGYTNGYYDYIPTIKAASEGGYGAADSNTYVDPGTGAEMLERAVVRLYEMLGKLTDSPEDLKRKSQQGGTSYRCPISATK